MRFFSGLVTSAELARLICSKVVLAGLLALIFLIASVHSSEADDPAEWRSLNEVVHDASSDITQVAYFAARCAGLSFSLSKAFSERADAVEVSDTMLNHGSRFMRLSTKINLKLGGEVPTQHNMDRQMKRESGTVIKMSNSYIDRMEQNYISTGTFFEKDPFMKNEIRTCMEFAKSLAN